MTYSKTACHAVASQAAAEGTLYFRCFPANTNNSAAFAAWQVAKYLICHQSYKTLTFFSGLNSVLYHKEENVNSYVPFSYFYAYIVYVWVAEAMYFKPKFNLNMVLKLIIFVNSRQIFASKLLLASGSWALPPKDPEDSYNF